jgi:hypothetical protein
MPLDQRILSKTDRSGECWLWLGRVNSSGYAQLTVDKRPRSAHRVSYETFVGPIPEGLEIDHLCRVRRCVRPQHLEAVTHRVNIQRAIDANGTVGGKRTGGMQVGDTCAKGHLVADDNIAYRRGLICCLTCRRETNRLSMSGGKPRQRKYTDHTKVAAEARGCLGEWVSVTTSASADSAYHTVHFIRSAKKLPAYQPAGSFEAEHRRTDAGFEVFARFVGTVEGGAR